MNDPNKTQLQHRPPGSSQRDVAFSNIFGSAPPPGRSQTLTSAVTPPFFPNVNHNGNSTANGNANGNANVNGGNINSDDIIDIKSQQSQSSRHRSVQPLYPINTSVAPPRPPPHLNGTGSASPSPTHTGFPDRRSSPGVSSSSSSSSSPGHYPPGQRQQQQPLLPDQDGQLQYPPGQYPPRHSHPNSSPHLHQQNHYNNSISYQDDAGRNNNNANNISNSNNMTGNNSNNNNRTPVDYGGVNNSGSATTNNINNPTNNIKNNNSSSSPAIFNNMKQVNGIPPSREYGPFINGNSSGVSNQQSLLMRPGGTGSIGGPIGTGTTPSHNGSFLRQNGVAYPAQDNSMGGAKGMVMSGNSGTGTGRSMSMTASSLNSSRNNLYSNTVTLSGRVIPQRQPNEVVINMNSAVNQHHGSVGDIGAGGSKGPNGSLLSGHKTSAGGFVAGNNKPQRTTSTSSSVDEPPVGGAYPNLSPHSTIVTTSRKVPLVYPALLSKVAEVFRQRIVLGDRVKNELTYKNSFTGAEAVDLITYIIKTPDRNLALLLGRALDAQKFFHDVTYDHRLRDTATEVYQFNEIVIEENDGNNVPQTLPLQSQSSTSSSRSASTSHRTLSQKSEDQAGTDSEPGATAVVPVNGVFTLLAECYSPTCTRDRLCYSIACPRRLEQQARLNMKPQPGLKRAESRLSLHGDDEKEQKLWIHTVSKEVADSVDDKEKKRQEVICEVIYTERDFVKDLEYLRDFWIKPLRNSNTIPEIRREKFIRAVFSHAMEVHFVNVKLAEALTKRQQLAPVVRQIGDIFLTHVPRFDPFIRYGANQLYGKYEFEREKSMNPVFAKFVDETERMKESRKLELNGYLTKPTTRLARYPLLLEAVLKHTSDDNPDKETIPHAIKLIREFLTKVNIETGKTENRFSLMQLNQSLVFRPGEYVDLKLTDEKRQIMFKGALKKRTGDKDNQGDVQVYLFDNNLLFVKVKVINKREQYKVHRKPIPLELLVMAEGEEILPKNMPKRSSSSLIPSAAKIQTTSKAESQNRYPITFQHLGRRGYELTLYSTTFIGRKKWIENIDTQREVLARGGDVYKRHVLQNRFFSPNIKINCMAPSDGGRKLLFGTDTGVFVSDVRITSNGPTASIPVKIITIPNVTQLDVLDEYMTLLALSDKSLYSWPLDVLDTPDPVGNNRRAKKVMGHINFYRVGICLGRMLVCTVKSSSMTSTVRVLEPFDPQPRNKRQTAPLRRLLQSQSEGLKVFKEFYIPSETLSISFLKRRLCVGCAKGFEIVDLTTLETQSLLDPADTSLDFAIRREALKPSSIYRLHSDFLLNYSDFSFFVNSNGWRSRPEWLIHWEGLPQHFALSYPYLIAFEPNFIEIRHMDTADIVRVITGENIRFLHESTREILYVHEDENGFDEVVSLDFWAKSSGSNDSPNSGTVPLRNDSLISNSTNATTIAPSITNASTASTLIENNYAENRVSM